jgi:coenzyme F420-reducing hydrogenase beta subunit
MQEDNEGFLYPAINLEFCTDCGLCEKVCPVICQEETHNKPLHVYAAKSKDEEMRLNSSSGGVFTLLAEKVIRNDGIVFGARFNERWEVVHDYTETIEGLSVFRGSKYVQSRIGKTYIQAKQFLKEGRYVLFSGTPCQIAGLKLFLRKEYDNLLTVDVVCHGVPSPKVWKEYLLQLIDNQRYMGGGKHVYNINMRDKYYGWKEFSVRILLSMEEDKISFRKKDKNSKNYSFYSQFSIDGKSTVIVEPLHKNIFLKGFLSNLYLRPSCHACPSKSFKSGSDITLGDYWGIQNVLPNFDDNKGVSLVMVNTQEGMSFFNGIDMLKEETSYASALKGNSPIEMSAKIPKKRALFFTSWKEGNVIPLIEKLTYQPFLMKMLFRIARLIKRKIKSIHG